MRDKTFTYFLILCCIFGFLAGGSKPSDASVTGNYYLQNFNGYGYGSTNFSWSDEGVAWGSFISKKPSSTFIAGNKIYQHSVTGTSGSIDFTVPTTFFNYTLTTNSYFGSGNYFDKVFYNSLGQRLFRIYLSNEFGGGAIHYWYVYGKTDATVLVSSAGVGSFNCSGMYSFTFYPSNSTVNLIHTVNHPYNVWYNLGVDFDLTIHFSIATGNDASGSLTYDNIYFLKDVSYPWETTSDYSIGSLLQTDSGNYSNTLISTEQYQIVEKYPLMQYGSIELKQFAFDVSNLCELSKISILLHINGIDLGYYDNSYYYSGDTNIAPKYILVWKNINETFFTDYLTIEVFITGITIPSIFSYPVFLGDIENDGIIQFKESLGLTSIVLPYFNGLYDGTQEYITKEPMYKMWFGSSSETSLCGIDFTGSSFKGVLTPSGTFNIGGKFIEISYNIQSTLQLNGFQLLVNKECGSSVYNYYLKINGEPYSHVDCISDYSDNLYLLTWNLTKLITNSNILFEVSCDNNLKIIRSSVPLDDGSIGVKYHSSYSLFNGIYDGNSYNYDIAYRFAYYGFMYENETLDYDDTISCLKTIYEIGEPVNIEWTTSLTIPNNYIHIDHNGSEYTSFGYPHILSGQLGNEIFTPIQTGNYKFYIVRNSITVCSFNVTVGHSENENYILFTYPNPSIVGEFKIYYKYNNENGNRGVITTSEFNYFNSSPIFQSYVNSNTSGNLSCSVSSASIYKYYVTLYEIILDGGIIQPSMLIQKIHYILSSYINNEIHTIPEFTGECNNKHPLHVIIYGTHNMLGSNVYITMNGLKISGDIGQIRDFRINIDITKPKEYIFRLIVETHNQTIELKNVTLSVSELIIKEESRPILEAPYTYIAGTILTLIMLILPALLLGKTNIQSEIFKYVPLFSGILGFIVSCMIGFFPWYAIFGLILALVVILAVIYQSKKG